MTRPHSRHACQSGLERVPIWRNWERALGFLIGRIFCGKPVSTFPENALNRALVEEVVDLARGLGADAGHLGEIGQSCALDRLQRPEMVKQRPLAGRADAGNLLQPGLADVAPSPDAVRPYREAMRFVAQPLHEIEPGITRLELERLPPGQKEGL